MRPTKWQKPARSVQAQIRAGFSCIGHHLAERQALALIPAVSPETAYPQEGSLHPLSA